ncbi:unnamed protein product [Calypogeia fissa]
MTWETFERQVNLKQKENLFSKRQLKAAALYLHEIGGIIYFDQKATTVREPKDRSVVVVHPEWFCRQVVGELLLPEEMLEDGCTLIQCDNGLIPTHWLEACFQGMLVEGIESDDVICMLERVGLCYRKGTNEIMVPALIKEDSAYLKDWEDEGCQFVIARSLSTEDYERTAIPITLFRQLQVELAQDTNFGGRGDSEYKAGKYSSSFKVGELSFLIQVDASSSNPNDDRIDILVKTVDPTKGSLSQVEGVCEIMEKLQVLCFACCPGLGYEIKIMKPWSATEETPEMTERQLMSLRIIKVLLLQGQQYSSWRVNGNAIELQTFLSNAEMKALLEIKIGIDEGTDDTDFPEAAVEETEEIDYYYDSDFSEGSEDPNVSLDEDEGDEFRDVSSETVEEIDELDIGSEPAVETNDDIGKLLADDILPVEETGSQAPLLSKVKASIEHESKDHQGLTLAVLLAGIQGLKSDLSDTRTYLHNAVYREGHAIRQHFDEGTKKLVLNAEEMKKQVLAEIQAYYSFSIAEIEKSVPRFMILAKKDSSGFWQIIRDTLKGLSRKDYRLYFLCEYQFDEGDLHLVKDQKGLELSKRIKMDKRWKKAAPWVEWLYYVAAVTAKIVLTALVPGTAGAIPTLSISAEYKAKDTAVGALQEKDETILERDLGLVEQLTHVQERLVTEGQGNSLSSSLLIDGKMKLIAAHVVKDLLREFGGTTFVDRTQLKKVLLKVPPQQDVGSSEQTEIVVWICKDCCEKFGPERARIIGPYD